MPQLDCEGVPAPHIDLLQTSPSSPPLLRARTGKLSFILGERFSTAILLRHDPPIAACHHYRRRRSHRDPPTIRIQPESLIGTAPRNSGNRRTRLCHFLRWVDTGSASHSGRVRHSRPLFRRLPKRVRSAYAPLLIRANVFVQTSLPHQGEPRPYSTRNGLQDPLHEPAIRPPATKKSS